MANHMEHGQFFCPTFTSYTADKSAETAARVATSPYLDDDDLNFEFDLVQTDLSLNDLLHSEKNGNMFPVFNQDISPDDVATCCHVDESDSSTSSDTEDQLYCVWRPKREEASPSRCKKSKSSGSGSKRWKLLEFLKRSNSEGKGDFLFLTPKNKVIRVNKKASAVEEFYVRSRASKEGQNRKSYLPYKKDLVGFFVKGVGKS